jgi:hypothetical protein
MAKAYKPSKSYVPKKIPKKIMYVTLLLIFSSSVVGLMADLETLYWVKAYVLLLILQGGFFLIYRSFYSLPSRRHFKVKIPFK